TGLTARQVVRVRCQPGGAGNIVANLCALGVGRVLCLGAIGDDGEGFELLRELRRLRVDVEGLVVKPGRFTPTYRKPVVREAGGGLRELERMDTKNRQPTPREIEEGIIGRVRELAPGLGAVIAQDQVQEVECGAITSRVREALGEMAREHPEVTWFVDSRVRVGEFRSMIVKPNRDEACAAVHPDSPAHDAAEAVGCAKELSARTGAPVYLTLGEEGMAVVTSKEVTPVPTVRLKGEIDIVGAGDSATSGIVASLCAGASPAEAAVVGNIVASITVEQLGTTGTASQEDVRQRFSDHGKVWEGF
ncbi:MAG: PfkB family carbohydrate kinase, partial [Armatimonadetes bacterium]|nr:PfkB family carbohydrate kinase [Armatimonadota bacterium]